MVYFSCKVFNRVTYDYLCYFGDDKFKVKFSDA